MGTPTRDEKQNAKGAKVLDRDRVKCDALDTMWRFVQIGGLKANVPALKENCELLQRMLTQKTAGQEAYRKRTDVDFADIDAVTNAIVIEAMALWLSGDLDKVDATQPADVVEVVRCGKCKYKRDTLYCRLRETPVIVSNADFCSYGKRRE